MSDNNYQEVIKNNKLFDGIPPPNLKFQFRNEQILRKKEGEIIFQKGDENQNTYLIIAGRVKLKIYIENKSVKLNKTINEFFGEIEVLENTYRRSAAVANTDCILYALNKSDLRRFIEEYQEINDNIIAYNKVEIPELQISIQHSLMKNDTDKLYITPPPEDKIPDILIENSVSEDEDDTVSDEAETDALVEIETETELPAEGKSAEEVNVPENEDVTFEPEETVKNEFDSDSDLTEELSEDTSDSFTEEVTEDTLGSVYTEGYQNTENTLPENSSGAEINDDNSAEAELQNPDINESMTEEIINTAAEVTENEGDTDISSEGKSSAEEEVNDTEKEIPEEELISQSVSDSVSLEAGVGETAGTEWVNLNSEVEEEKEESSFSEEEKIHYEAEDQKLKYDDTEIDSERILNAVKKINSSLDKHTVYANIVLEAVKITEAQAGILYRVDSLKNMLITEQETEDGLKDVSYSLSGGLTGLAAETGEIINVREPVKDFRYSEDIDSIRGTVGSSMLCVPIKNDAGETIAVLSLANSSSGKFSLYDEEKISQIVPHIAQTLQFVGGIEGMLDENRNVFLSTLTKFIADNIQTPVLTMKYYAGQIKKKNIPQDVRTVLSVLMDQADSVIDFLNSTLAFTENRNPLKIEKFSLQEVMDDALGLLAEYVESRNVGLYKKVESDISVKLDKKAFYQACHQIAKNACDAMGENGNIYITAKQSGDLVDIEFRDTGPGVPDGIKEEIFGPFQSYNKEKGTGLGLTIARKIIRDHGGELTVESNPESGATFIISLPVFDDV